MLIGVIFMVVSYGALCALVRVEQESLIFFPSHDLAATPDQLSMPYQALPVACAGSSLMAWKIPAAGVSEKSQRWILHCHGNGGNMSHRLHVAKFFHELGYGVILFDYPGYGQSQGKIQQESDLISSGQAVLDQFDPHRVVVYGESLGGGVAAQLACKNPVAGLVLQSTFTSFTSRAGESFPFLPVSWLCRYKLNSLAAVEQLDVPKLVLHSRNDEVTGFHHAEQLYAKAKEPKFMGELTGSHNDFSLKPEQIQPFLSAAFPQ